MNPPRPKNVEPTRPPSFGDMIISSPHGKSELLVVGEPTDGEEKIDALRVTKQGRKITYGLPGAVSLLMPEGVVDEQRLEQILQDHPEENFSYW